MALDFVLEIRHDSGHLFEAEVAWTQPDLAP